MSVPLSNPEDALAALTQLRSAEEQRALITDVPDTARQTLIESISTKIRELLPRDPDLAQILAETNLYVASLLDTSLAWAYANRSRAQVFYTMRKSLEAEPYFDKAVQLFARETASASVNVSHQTHCLLPDDEVFVVLLHGGRSPRHLTTDN